MATYLGILRPPEDGVHGVEILGLNVNGQGDTMASAIEDAAEIMHEVITDLTEAGEPVPAPIEPTEADLSRGTLVAFHTQAPAEAA